MGASYSQWPPREPSLKVAQKRTIWRKEQMSRSDFILAMALSSSGKWRAVKPKIRGRISVDRMFCANIVPVNQCTWKLKNFITSGQAETTVVRKSRIMTE